MGVPPSSDEVENPSSFLRAYNTRSDNDSYEEEEEIIENQNDHVLKSLEIITKAPVPHRCGQRSGSNWLFSVFVILVHKIMFLMVLMVC